MADEFADFPEAGDAAAQDDEFADFEQSSTFADQAITAAQQTGRGALVTGSALAGGATGFQLGTIAAPFTGPLAPAMPVLGAAGGFMYGAVAAEEASQGLGVGPVESLPPELRSAGYFGESLGGSLTILSAPYAAAVTGYRFAQTTVGNYLNQIINTAKTQPIKYGLAEGSAALSAAGAAGLAEEVAPGQTGVRITSEVAGGILNPTRLTLGAVNYGTSILKRGWEGITPSGRETAAARVLSDILAVTGEDPEVLARILRDPNIIGSENVTAAQKTGSLGLSALEAHLSDFSKQFGAESQQKARDAMDILRTQITLLSNTGDPAALQAAAEMRSVYYRTLIQGRLDSAERAAQTAAGKITKDTPGAREALSKQARGALEQSLSDARKAESELWNQVDGTRTVGFDNLQSTYDSVRADLLPEVRNEKTPKIVRDFLARISAPKEEAQSLIILPENISRQTTAEAVGTNVKEMRQLRSELLDMARSSTNAGEFGQARIFSNLAEAVLDDMDAAFVQAGDTAYQSARTFSREFNETFSRSFAGRATAQGKYGDRVAPEILLRKALATGKEAGALQLQELEEATRFMVNRGLGSDEAMKNMLDAQDRILRLAAADTLNPLTGQVDPKKVATFLRDNETLMKRFPEIKNDLMLAVTSEQKRADMANLATRQLSTISKQKALGKMLTSDPVAMAGRMLISTNQEKELTDLINLAKPGYTPRGGVTPVSSKDAIDGLRASVYDAAVIKSTRNGVLDLDLFRGFLFTPSVPGKKSPIQIMQDSGVVDSKHVADIKKLLDAAGNITRSQRPGTKIDVRSDLGDVALITISRAIGSGVAGATAKAAGSNTPSLIVHGAGARLAETAMTKVPATSAKMILIEAMNDPQKMALLLMKADTPEKSAQQARQINAWLVQSGISSLTEPVTRDYEERPAAPEFFSQPR